MQDDIALRSQQYALQADSTRIPYDMAKARAASEAGGAVGMGIGRTFDRMQRQSMFDARRAMGEQSLALDRARVVSELESDRLRQQQAQENLQWARALHSTDMVRYQKDMVKADRDLHVARAQKEMMELHSTDADLGDVNSYEEMMAIRAQGLTAKMVGGRLRIEPLGDPKAQAEAKQALGLLRSRMAGRSGDLGQQLRYVNQSILDMVDAGQDSVPTGEKDEKGLDIHEPSPTFQRLQKLRDALTERYTQGLQGGKPGPSTAGSDNQGVDRDGDAPNPAADDNQVDLGKAGGVRNFDQAWKDAVPDAEKLASELISEDVMSAAGAGYGK